MGGVLKVTRQVTAGGVHGGRGGLQVTSASAAGKMPRRVSRLPPAGLGRDLGDMQHLDLAPLTRRPVEPRCFIGVAIEIARRVVLLVVGDGHANERLARGISSPRRRPEYIP